MGSHCAFCQTPLSNLLLKGEPPLPRAYFLILVSLTALMEYDAKNFVESAVNTAKKFSTPIGTDDIVQTFLYNGCIERRLFFHLTVDLAKEFRTIFNLKKTVGQKNYRDQE